MRRVFSAAIIGGLIGFAVLLNLSMLKAGCWRNAQCDLWSMLLLPSTHFQVQELVLNGQLLLFKKELLESCVDYFGRGAGLGVILLLLFDAVVTWLRKHESAIPPGFFAFAVRLSKHSSVFVTIAWFVPSLVSIMGFFYLLADGYLDATSVAILVPSLPLIALVLAAALKKRLFLWQVRSSQSSESDLQERAAQEPHPRRALLMSLQLAVYVLSPFFAYCILNICSQHLHWESMVQDANSRSSDHYYDLARAVCIAETMNILVTVLSTGVIVYLIEVILYRVFAREKSLSMALLAGPLLNAALISWCLIWLLPAIHLVAFSPYLVGFSHRLLAMEVFRVCVSLSTLPSSAFGLAVALARVGKPTIAPSSPSSSLSPEVFISS